MVQKYAKHVIWFVVPAIVAYDFATYYAKSTVDVFTLWGTYMVAYTGGYILHEKVLKYKYRDFFTYLLSNPPKDKGHRG